MARAALEFDANWLADLRAKANQPPLCPRVPLLAGAEAVGSILPELMHQIYLKPSSSLHSLLLKQELLIEGSLRGEAWRIGGPPAQE